MDQQQQQAQQSPQHQVQNQQQQGMLQQPLTGGGGGGVHGPTGRRLHIAHRRSPSELTPLMSMFANPGSKSFARLHTGIHNFLLP